MNKSASQHGMIGSVDEVISCDKPATILLVDDEKVVRMVARRRLERLGHKILEAENGRQALEKLRREAVDLVISDWMMPEMDGPTLCEIVKADEELRSTPIILMTALDQPAQIAEGLSRGADDFLTKSASDQEITARVNAGLRTCRLIHELANSFSIISQKQAELDAELQTASEFVLSLLPEPREIVPGIHLDWQYLPSSKLGGDLFQVTPWGTDHLGIMILDMSGHGMGPALRAISLSMIFQSANIAKRFPSYEPSEIVRALNRENPITELGEYFTIWVGTLHVPTRELRYATAGHPGAILMRAGQQAKTLGGQTLPIGFNIEEAYETKHITLAPEDRLYLFSDGIYEVMSPGEQLWGCEGLEEACRIVHEKPLGKALSWIIQQSKAWQKQETFGDDVALVGLDVR